MFQVPKKYLMQNYIAHYFLTIFQQFTKQSLQPHTRQYSINQPSHCYNISQAMLDIQTPTDSEQPSPQPHPSPAADQSKSISTDSNSEKIPTHHQAYPPLWDSQTCYTPQLYYSPRMGYYSHYHGGYTTTPQPKEKLELCRKFMDYGRCPYGNRCKFAHGAHQLRQNEQLNDRYKTKECGTFFKQGYCKFGNRCNFLHTKKDGAKDKKAELKKIMRNHRDCIHEMRTESRLLRMLGLEPEGDN